MKKWGVGIALAGLLALGAAARAELFIADDLLYGGAALILEDSTQELLQNAEAALQMEGTPMPSVSPSLSPTPSPTPGEGWILTADGQLIQVPAGADAVQAVSGEKPVILETPTESVQDAAQVQAEEPLESVVPEPSMLMPPAEPEQQSAEPQVQEVQEVQSSAYEENDAGMALQESEPAAAVQEQETEEVQLQEAQSADPEQEAAEAAQAEREPAGSVSGQEKLQSVQEKTQLQEPSLQILQEDIQVQSAAEELSISDAVQQISPEKEEPADGNPDEKNSVSDHVGESEKPDDEAGKEAAPAGTEQGNEVPAVMENAEPAAVTEEDLVFVARREEPQGNGEAKARLETALISRGGIEEDLLFISRSAEEDLTGEEQPGQENGQNTENENESGTENGQDKKTKTESAEENGLEQGLKSDSGTEKETKDGAEADRTGSASKGTGEQDSSFSAPAGQSQETGAATPDEAVGQDVATRDEASQSDSEQQGTGKNEGQSDPAEDLTEESPVVIVANGGEDQTSDGQGTNAFYVKDGEAYTFGTLPELIAQSMRPIYLNSTDVFEVTHYGYDSLLSLGIQIGEGLPQGFSVIVSPMDPSGEEKEGVIFLWAGVAAEEEDEEALFEEIDYEIEVRPEAEAPVGTLFTLKITPELNEGMTLGVLFEDGLTKLSGLEYTPEKAGTYQFCIVDAEGEIVTRSARRVVTEAGLLARGEESPTPSPKPTPTPSPTPTPTPEPDPVMHVTSGKYTENQWSRNQITFDLELSSTPSDWGVSRFLEVFIVKEGESETHTVLQNNHYEPEDGNYKVYFAITDGNGKISSRTSTYTVMQDTTAPILIVQRTDGYGLIITAKDGISGATQVSVDGGKKFIALTDVKDGTMKRAFQATSQLTLPAGTIVVRDAAGNLTRWNSAVTLISTEKTPTQLSGTTQTATTGFSFGGGYGRASRSIGHSTSKETSIVAYNGVELEILEEAMSQLTLGTEPLDLYLRRTDSTRDREESTEFTALFTAWDSSSSEMVDTIVLTPAETTEGTYKWTFSGTVNKKLAASGIEYLVLTAGEHEIGLSTAGFSGGSQYDRLRSSGKVSKDFIYTVEMDPADWSFTIEVAVDGKTYHLTKDENGEFYYHDVYTGKQGTWLPAA